MLRFTLSLWNDYLWQFCKIFAMLLAFIVRNSAVPLKISMKLVKIGKILTGSLKTAYKLISHLLISVGNYWTSKKLLSDWLETLWSCCWLAGNYWEEDCSPLDVGVVLKDSKSFSDPEKLHFIENQWSRCVSFSEFPANIESGKQISQTPAWVARTTFMTGLFEYC